MPTSISWFTWYRNIQQKASLKGTVIQGTIPFISTKMIHSWAQSWSALQKLLGLFGETGWLIFFSASSLGYNKLLLQNCTLLTLRNIWDIDSRDPDQFTDLLLCFLTQVLLWGSWLGGLIWGNVESTCFIQGCFLCELVTTQSKKSLVSNTAGSLTPGPKPPALVALMQ